MDAFVVAQRAALDTGGLSDGDLAAAQQSTSRADRELADFQAGIDLVATGDRSIKVTLTPPG